MGDILFLNTIYKLFSNLRQKELLPNKRFITKFSEISSQIYNIKNYFSDVLQIMLKHLKIRNYVCSSSQPFQNKMFFIHLWGLRGVKWSSRQESRGNKKYHSVCVPTATVQKLAHLWQWKQSHLLFYLPNKTAIITLKQFLPICYPKYLCPSWWYGNTNKNININIHVKFDNCIFFI